VLETNLATIESELRRLRENSLITDGEFWDFQKRLWKPKTRSELEEIAKELAELARTRQESEAT